MDTISYDGAACARCGACARNCPSGAIELGAGGAQRKVGSRCSECMHCVAYCPTGAARPDARRFQVVEAASPQLARRSCRSFGPRPVERTLLERLAREADLAPRMGKPLSRGFIFVTEPRTMEALREALARRIRENARLLGFFAALPLPPLGIVGLGRRLGPHLAWAAKKIASGWDLFHGAPVLAAVHAKAGEEGKIEGTYAMQQLLLSAQAAGLGSCVCGWADGFSDTVVRVLGMPADRRISAAAILGYPTDAPRRAALRLDLEVQWR